MSPPDRMLAQARYPHEPPGTALEFFYNDRHHARGGSLTRRGYGGGNARCGKELGLLNREWVYWMNVRRPRRKVTVRYRPPLVSGKTAADVTHVAFVEEQRFCFREGFSCYVERDEIARRLRQLRSELRKAFT